MLRDFIEIKTAVSTDALPMAYVARTTFYDSWSHIYTKEDMKLYCDEAFNLGTTEEAINNASNTFLLASVNGKVAGYSKLRRDTIPEGLEGAFIIEVERVYVLNEFHKKRIGYELMNRCMSIAQKEKYQWVWLGVNEFNNTAVDFYKRFGFEVFGKKPFQIGTIKDEDLMMKKKLH